MARFMHEGSPEVFRAIISVTEVWREGDEPRTHTEVRGPFEDKRQASAAVTRAKRPDRWSRPASRVATGRVQRAALVWEDV